MLDNGIGVDHLREVGGEMVDQLVDGIRAQCAAAPNPLLASTPMLAAALGYTSASRLPRAKRKWFACFMIRWAVTSPRPRPRPRGGAAPTAAQSTSPAPPPNSWHANCSHKAIRFPTSPHAPTYQPVSSPPYKHPTRRRCQMHEQRSDVSMVVLSLGAGVQSTTLALMASGGELPKPDAAIFADTGWEPKAVYEHLDRLAAELGRAGIPLHRVAEGNQIADIEAGLNVDENGDPDGCSPAGCRSGAQAEGGAA